MNDKAVAGLAAAAFAAATVGIVIFEDILFGQVLEFLRDAVEYLSGLPNPFDLLKELPIWNDNFSTIAAISALVTGGAAYQSTAKFLKLDYKNIATPKLLMASIMGVVGITLGFGLPIVTLPMIVGITGYLYLSRKGAQNTTLNSNEPTPPTAN